MPRRDIQCISLPADWNLPVGPRRSASMRVTVSKWGNSLGLRLPKAIAEEMAIVEGSSVDLRVEDGRLVVQRVAATLALHDLLRGVTSKNLHTEILDAPARGRELW